MSKKNVLIVGLFTDPNTNPVTQAGELAKGLRSKGYNVLSVSHYRNRWVRLVDIILSMILKRKGFEVCIVQFYSGNSFIWQSVAGYLAKWLNKKLVFTIHGGGVPERIRKYPDRYLKILRKADIITAPSNYIIDELKKYGLDVTLVENSIQLRQYPFYNKTIIRPRLLWMRAFSDLYDPLMALDVLNNILPAYPDAHLYMGGADLGLENAVKNEIQRRGLANNITMTGFMDIGKKIQYAGEADIYISTNKIDNAPVTFIEMAAMGLPIVSTNVGGIPYLLTDNVSGILVEDGDAKGMADKIIDLVRSKEKAQTIIVNARNGIERYSEEAVYDKWNKLLGIA